MREICDVCGKIAHIVSGLASGTVDFVYDNFVQEGDKTHPAQILDDIFCGIGDTLYEDPDAFISTEAMKTMLRELKRFRRCFRVAELMQPISQLEAYLNSTALPAAA